MNIERILKHPTQTALTENNSNKTPQRMGECNKRNNTHTDCRVENKNLKNKN